MESGGYVRLRNISIMLELCQHYVLLCGSELRLTGQATMGQMAAVLVPIVLLVLVKAVTVAMSGDPSSKEGAMSMSIYNTVGFACLETFWTMETNIVTSALPA